MRYSLPKTKVTSTDQLQKGLEKLSDSLNEKFQKANKENISDNQKFFDEIVKTVIEQKINLIKQEELPIDEFNKSDLFTDEEIKNMQDKQKNLCERIIEREKKTNL